jgi:membrane fusion protein, heavy metal efflux system
MKASILFLLITLSMACDAQKEHGHAHGEDAHAQEAPERASEAITRWGQRTQLFVEFPTLVVGVDSAFAAHLTRLADHRAVAVGTVVVELSGGAGSVERFTVSGPTVPGIFRPVVRPASAGKRQVVVRLEGAEGVEEVHDLGELTVYQDQAKANAAAPPDDNSGIAFLLEQQWVIPFSVSEAKERSMRPTIAAFSKLSMPSDAETVLLAPRDGRVIAASGVFAQVGDVFEEGAVVAALKSGPQEAAEPASLELAVSQATIQAQIAQRDIDRLSPLVERGVVAQRRLDDALAAREQAQAEQRAAQRRRSSLEQSQRVKGRGEAVSLPSPIRGTLAELYVTPGQWVRQGDPIARIANRDALWLDVFVPQAYISDVREVSGAWVQLGELMLEVGREALVSVASELDPQLKTLRVRFRVPNPDHKLYAGMSAQAHLVAQAPRLAVAIPFDAVVDDAGVDVVYVQRGGERFERRAVRLGVRDGTMVEVLEGVMNGEWVASTGAYSIKLASTSTAAVGQGHAH